MRNLYGCLALAGALAVAMRALAADPPPQKTADDYARELSRPATIASLPVSDHNCPGGMGWNEEDQFCTQLKGPTGGFNFGARMGRAPQHAPVVQSAAIRHATSIPKLIRVSNVAASTDLLITFETGSFDLTSQARANAREFAKYLGHESARHFEIAGHTDAVGGREFNISLSQKRADAVKTFLIAQGVNSAQLETRGYGFDQPRIADDPNAAGNRRVEAKSLDQ